MAKAPVSPQHYLLACVVVVLWGLNFVFSKSAATHFAPFTTLLLRFAIVSAILLPFFRKPPIPVKSIISISFVFAVLHLGLMFWSLAAGLDASVGIVAMQLHVAFSLLLGIVFFKEKVGWRSGLGVIIAIIGSVILMGTPNSINNSFSFFAMIGGAFFLSVYSLQLKAAGAINPFALTAWICLFAFPMMVPFSFWLEENQLEAVLTADLYSIGSLLYICLTSIFAHSLWGYLLARNPIEAIAPLTLFVPVIGVFAGILLLGEVVTESIIWGTILMIIGVAFVVIRRPNIVDFEG